jgi:hypothetical protein
MKKQSFAALLALFLLVAWAGVAAAAPSGRGGHAGPGAHGGGHAQFHGGARPMHGRGGRGFHGHPGHFRHGFRGGVFVGAGPFWWDPYPPFLVAPSVIEAPVVYIQQAPAAQFPAGYWYYCPSAGAYYPSVATCSEPWVLVPPTGG